MGAKVILIVYAIGGVINTVTGGVNFTISQSKKQSNKKDSAKESTSKLPTIPKEFTLSEDINLLTDARDNKVYKIVGIGNQTWMAENLAYNPFSGNYWAYNNDFSNVSKYGYLYDWETACKVCPIGWSLPYASDWDLLMKTLGGTSGAGIKMKDTKGWGDNGNGNNISLFSGLPGGFVDLNQINNDSGNIGYWWVATEKNALNPTPEKKAYRYLHANHDYLGQDIINKNFLLSVRCIKDNYNP